MWRVLKFDSKAVFLTHFPANCGISADKTFCKMCKIEPVYKCCAALTWSNRRQKEMNLDSWVRIGNASICLVQVIGGIYKIYIYIYRGRERQRARERERESESIYSI